MRDPVPLGLFQGLEESTHGGRYLPRATRARSARWARCATTSRHGIALPKRPGGGGAHRGKGNAHENGGQDPPARTKPVRRRHAVAAPHPYGIPARRRSGFQVGDGLLDGRHVDPAALLRVADHEGVVADGIDDARDAAGEGRDAIERPRREELGIPSARDAQPGPDVVPDLGLPERLDVVAERDPLLQLPELLAPELGMELRLAHQDDLEELVARGLEVREEPDLLERRHVEVLGLVEDQDGVPVRAPLLDQEAVEGDESLGVREAGRGHAPLLERVLEEALERKRGVEDEGDAGVAAEALQQRVEERRLARSDLAGEREKPLALAHAVDELRQRLAVTLGREEEARVRRRPEGRLAEPVERRGTRLRASARPAWRRGTRCRGPATTPRPRPGPVRRGPRPRPAGARGAGGGGHGAC